MKTSTIKFNVTVDENHLPEKIEWEAPDAGNKSTAESVMIALWDKKENNTLRIDLWTKNMSIDEMKKFYVQNLLTLTETYLRATGDDIGAGKAKKFFQEFGKELNVLQ
ncbi:MAG: gliding motility protein GldC [Sphingobacteriaceae bacterium]|nr:gliding motility protein GldC [Sphingobacteriaceae bacterium]